MHLIIGLGNPGAEYEGTRHNVGFAVARALCAKHHLTTPVASAKYSGLVSEGVVGGASVMVGFPETYMNHSGVMVKKMLATMPGSPVIVIYDDIDLPIGQWKIAARGGSGGHNGVTSVINSLGSKDFVRVRVGIAPVSFWTGKSVRPKGDKLPRYVLGKFTKREETQLASVLPAIVDGLESILHDGVERAMNTFN